MEVFTVATLVTLIWKVVSALKDATGGDPRGALTQAVTWVVGIGVAFLAASADATSEIVIWGTTTLGELDGASLVLAGFSLASAASAAYDYKAAIDDSDSAVEPPIGGGPRP